MKIFMGDYILKIGKRKSEAIDLIEIAHGCFVFSRVALNSPMAMFSFLPIAFFLMHHSIELCIKAFLLFEKITYNYNKDGHKILSLLKIGATNSSRLSFFKDEILDRKDFYSLLSILEQSYNDNRYSFAGYDIKSESVRDLFDELIFIFTERFCALRGKKDRVTEQIMAIDVPEPILPLFEYKLKQPFTVCVLPNDLID